MATTGRNQPCPCGSGKKYKQCCMEKDEAKALALAKPAPTREEQRKARAAQRARSEALAELEADFAESLAEDEGLDEASNAVVDLIRAGRLDEAERAAHQLLKDYPYVPDGFDRLGMVHEARGNNKMAADFYREVLAFLRDHRDINHDPEAEQAVLRRIARLDPDPAS